MGVDRSDTEPMPNLAGVTGEADRPAVANELPDLAAARADLVSRFSEALRPFCSVDLDGVDGGALAVLLRHHPMPDVVRAICHTADPMKALAAEIWEELDHLTYSEGQLELLSHRFFEAVVNEMNRLYQETKPASTEKADLRTQRAQVMDKLKKMKKGPISLYIGEKRDSKTESELRNTCPPTADADEWNEAIDRLVEIDRNLRRIIRAERDQLISMDQIVDVFQGVASWPEFAAVTVEINRDSQKGARTFKAYDGRVLTGTTKLGSTQSDETFVGEGIVVSLVQKPLADDQD